MNNWYTVQPDVLSIFISINQAFVWVITCTLKLIRNILAKAYLLFFYGIVNVGKAALSTILTIKMGSHENSGTTFLTRALTPQPMDFSIVIHTVILKDRQFYLLVLMFNLFWRGVILLLALLAATAETQYQVQRGFCFSMKPKKILFTFTQHCLNKGIYLNVYCIPMSSSTLLFNNLKDLPFWML